MLGTVKSSDIHLLGNSVPGPLFCGVSPQIFWWIAVCQFNLPLIRCFVISTGLCRLPVV